MFLMFTRQGYFSFCHRFHIESLKMAAYAELHFNITCQMTSIVPGTKTVLRNRAWGFVHAQVSCPQEDLPDRFQALVGQFMFSSQ